MPRESTGTPEDLALSLYRLAREVPASQFQTAAFGLIRPSLQFESGFWVHGVRLPDDGVQVEAAHLLEFPTESLVEWQHINRQDTVVVECVRNAGRVGIFHAPQLFQARDDAVMLDYARRWGRQNYLSVVIPHADPKVINGMSFYRSHADRHYTRHEQAFLQRFVVHMNEALVISQVLNAMTFNPADPQATRGMLVADRGGRVLRADAESQRLLAREWAEYDGTTLPPPLLDAIANDADRAYRGRCTHCTGQFTAGIVTLRVRARSPVDNLPPRRAMVARAFAAGHDYKQIARLAGIAPTTVRNHLREVYASLRVKTRAELAALLKPDDLAGGSVRSADGG